MTATALTEKVIWTLCPQGRTADGKSLKFSIFVSPRLTANGSGATLALPTAWRDWAKVVSDCTFGLQPMAGPNPTGTAIPGKVVSRTFPQVYLSLFPPSTPVKDYVFKDLSGKLILSYPVKQLADLITDSYTKLAIGAGDDLPKGRDLIDARWPAYLSKEEKRKTQGVRPKRNQLLAAIKQSSIEAVAATPAGLFDVFSLYHKPLLAEKTFNQVGTAENGLENATWPGFKKPVSLPSREELVDRTDFHKIAAAISNYPELARYCGLVIDVEVPFDPLATGAKRFSVFVKRSSGGGHDIDSCPTTICVLAPGKFAAASDPARVDNGFLVMQRTGLDLIQFDVDGAAHKAVGLAASLDRMRVSEINDNAFDDTVPQPEATAPTLRTSGFMVAQAKRHLDVEKGAVKAASLNAGLTSVSGVVPDLTANELLRGYRVDIIDMSLHSPKWRSLHRRNVQYTFLNGVKQAGDLGWTTESNVTTGVSLDQEGMVSTALGSSPDNSVPGVYTLHESLFVWRGWSLSAPEPFKVLTSPATPPDPSATIEEQHAAMIGENSGEVPKGLPLQTAFTVAMDPASGGQPPRGTLPALRFGHVYQARLRTVDLTGASARYDAVSSDQTLTAPITYRRFEAIEAPVLTLWGDVTNADRTCDWTKTDYPLQGESMGRLALRSYYDEASHKHRDPEIAKVRRNLAPPRVTQRFAETHGACDADDQGHLRAELYETLCRQDLAFAETQMPASDLIKPKIPVIPADAPKPSRYSVSGNKFALPYLPDPYAVAIRARLKRLGDTLWTDIQIPLYQTVGGTFSHEWPKSRPITIEGSENYNDFAFDDASRTLQVPMPKGCRNKIRLSCVMAPPTLDFMGLWALIVEGAKTNKEANLKALRQMVLEGKHWMFTPWREIELIHATQKPLTVPDFIKFDVGRVTGALDANLSFTTPLSGRSTVRLDINASWNEPEDNTVAIDAKSHPVNRQFRDVAVQMPISRSDGFSGPYSVQAVPHHFHDTRARKVTYQMDAISRFKEFFERPLRDSEDDMKVTSTEAVKWVRSSAPPPAPSVLYVIPTFGWFHKGGDLPASRRTGGLRVYLDRPWMASGFNEMLAVLLPDEPDNVAPTGDDAKNLPFVTQWGRDPLRLSADINTNSPRRSAFKLAKMAGPVRYPGADLFPATEGEDLPVFQTTGLTVPGQSPGYAVAPHEVGFDPVRQLWYADIVVGLPRGSYFPFIRLAVARYQPVSTPSAHLSPAVTCDFMQLSADRIAVIVPMDGLDNKYKVFVYGDQPDDPSGVAGEGKAKRGFIYTQTQVLDAGLDDSLGWRDAWGNPIKKPFDPSLNPAPEPVDTSKTQARSVADELAATAVDAPLYAPVTKAGPQAQVQMQMRSTNALTATSPVRMAFAGPDLIWEEIFYAPPTPAGGKRRLLITETESFPHVGLDSNGRVATTMAERIVYAEGIEF